MVTREVLGSGLRLITEKMPHVRSVSIGVWLTRGSRHEAEPEGGIAHVVEHMLFKGTGTRTAEDIAQAIDSIGGQLDAFTAKEYASYYIKVLDEHLPLAVDLLSDIVMNPRFEPDDLEREKKVILEEIKMVEDTPDDLVHELFTQHFWEGHALGRPILGSKETVESFTSPILRDYFSTAYVAPNLIVSAAGNVEHAQVRELVQRAFAALPGVHEPFDETVPRVVPQVIDPVEGSRAEPRLPRHEQLSAEPRRPLRRLHHEHRARRLDELPPVSERPRKARSRVCRVQWSERVP